MRAKRILSVVGARPNFVKIAPLLRALARRPDGFVSRLVHTGQHYDPVLTTELLDLPAPDVNLGVGSGTHAEQLGRTLLAIEPAIRDWAPDWLVVTGDVNATCAAALAGVKMGVPVAHVEAGLRSFDRAMPEEINRIVADQVASLLFTTDGIADDNLRREGIPAERIRRVGNIMIDTLDACREAASALDLAAVLRPRLAVAGHAGRLDSLKGGYAAVTLHRPANVDPPSVLAGLVDCLAGDLAGALPVVWVLHPRTRGALERNGLWSRLTERTGVIAVSPLDYAGMLKLQMGARVMLTDSGGLQEESCVLGTPCAVLRDTTERPVTLEEQGGTCTLAGNRPERIREVFSRLLGRGRAPFRPPLWDGRTAERMVEVLAAMP